MEKHLKVKDAAAIKGQMVQLWRDRERLQKANNKAEIIEKVNEMERMLMQMSSDKDKLA